MSDFAQQARRQGGSREPRFTPLKDFLDRNGIDPLDYLHEVLGGETDMPLPVLAAGNLCVETERETRWRSRVISGTTLKLGRIVGPGGWRHGRR